MEETYTFPSAEKRNRFKQSILASGVTYSISEEDKITEHSHCYMLYLVKLSPSLKQVLSNSMK